MLMTPNISMKKRPSSSSPQRCAQTKVIKYEINMFTMQFADKVLNEEFDDYLLNKDADQLSLTFLMTYNVLTGPAFLYTNLYIDNQPLSGHYGRLGQFFVYTVSQIYCLFFVMLFMEKKGFYWLLNHWGGGSTRYVQRMRMVLIASYILLVPCGTGLAMLVKIRNLCSPEQLSIHEIYICSTSSPGAIPVDSFCVGNALIIFLQFAFPTPWWVVMLSWSVQLAALLLSAYEFTTPQTVIYNGILITFHVITIVVHIVIHWNIMQTFAREQVDSDTNTYTVPEMQSVSLSQDVKDGMIVEYLASLHHRQLSGGNPQIGGTGDTAGNDDESVGSSVSISEYSFDVNEGEGGEEGERERMSAGRVPDPSSSKAADRPDSAALDPDRNVRGSSAPLRRVRRSKSKKMSQPLPTGTAPAPVPATENGT